jgi:hypothetical protein
MEPLRQHYLLATGKGLQKPPDPNPKPGSVRAEKVSARPLKTNGKGK